ncbi:MAG: PAS domain S-box protein [Burkholderiales bacterium]
MNPVADLATGGAAASASQSDSMNGAFHRLFEALVDPMLIADAEGRVVAGNPPCLRLFGYGQSDFVGLPVDALLPERFRRHHAQLRTAFAAAPAARPMALSRAVFGLRKDGSEFAADVSLSPIDQGQVLVSVHDVSDRLQAARALKDSEERYRLLVEQAVDGIFVSDASGLYRDVNSAGAAMLGYAQEEVVGLTIPDLVVESEHPRIDAELSKLNAGHVARGEWRFRRKDGSIFVGEVVARRLPDGNLLGVLRDITARRETEEALRESETRFRAAFEQAAVGIAHLSPDGRWLRVNGTLCRMLGQEEATLRGARVADAIHPEHRAGELAHLARLASSPRDHAAREYRLLTASGAAIWVRVTLSIVQHGDVQSDYFLAVVEDIRARKEAESVLRKLRGEMQNLLERHIARQTAEAIAHDLNQPLVAVASYTEAAVRMLRGGNPDPERLMRALEGSAQQAQRAGRVVRELLEYLHKGETTTQPVDLNEVVRHALALVESNGLDGFETVLDLDPQLRPVRANQVQVEKVLVNLINNSVEAMASAGLEKRRIHIGIRTQQHTGIAQVTVTDTGPGLDQRTAARIFEPFFTTKPRGVGMGLSISRALIESQGGQLWLDTDAGPGATFHFTLPLLG